MNTITKGDFLTMVKLNHLEVLTQVQLSQNTKVIHSYMQKALTAELSADEVADGNAMISDVGSLQQWEVLRDDFTKAVVYTRPEQVLWEDAERGEFGEIIKAKSGVYKLTAENKKLGRVGQKYGEKEEGNMPTIRTEAQRRAYEKQKEKDSGGAFIAPKYKDEEKEELEKEKTRKYYSEIGTEEKVTIAALKRAKKEGKNAEEALQEVLGTELKDADAREKKMLEVVFGESKEGNNVKITFKNFVQKFASGQPYIGKWGARDGYLIVPFNNKTRDAQHELNMNEVLNHHLAGISSVEGKIAFHPEGLREFIKTLRK